MPDPSDLCPRCGATGEYCKSGLFEDVGFGPVCCEDCSHRDCHVCEFPGAVVLMEMSMIGEPERSRNQLCRGCAEALFDWIQQRRAAVIEKGNQEVADMRRMLGIDGA